MLLQRHLQTNTSGSGVRNRTAANQGAGAVDTADSEQKESTGVAPANRQGVGAKDTVAASQKESKGVVPATNVCIVCSLVFFFPIL